MIKRSSFNKILISVLIIIVVAISPNKIASSENALYIDIRYPSVFELTNDDKIWIENKLNEMSLSDKCAQMIMPAVYREDIDTSSEGYKKMAALVKDGKIGGLILFQSGLIEQAMFVNAMQSIADIPLLISSDFERGLGNRIDNATEFPHAMALGSTHNTTFAYEMGKAISHECSIIGVHWNFAPVADINNNPLNPVINIRAYSEDINEVSGFVKAFIDGSKNTRLLTSAKHFPGHGNTEIDSHYDLPRINGDKDFLKSNELKPFQDAINAGVHSIMIGHLEVPSLDPIPGTPSTLSKPVITKVLKNEMGFDGLIITDAMNMEAVTKYYSSEEAAVLAVIAGIDVILMPPDPETAIIALESAVLSGRITLERINESVRKILAAKRWLQIDSRRFSDISSLQKSLEITEHFQLSTKIAEESITLIKNYSNLIPLDYSKFKNIYCITITDGEGSERSQYFKTMLEKRLVNINSELLIKISKQDDYNHVLDTLRNADLIILPVFIDVKTYQGPINLFVEQTDFISSVLKLNIPTILISFRNPYLASLFPEAATIINTFSHSRVSQKAVLRAILGETEILGSLPVTIPETEFSYGDGLIVSKSINTELEYDLLNQTSFLLTDQAITDAINQKLFPGAVVCFGRKGKLLYNKAFGNADYGDNSYKLQTDDVLDIGYSTRIVAGLSALLILIDQKLINPDDKVHTYFKDFYSYDKKDITIRHLISHSSGFGMQINNLKPDWSRDELLHAIAWQILDYKTGTDVILSPVNDIILQLLIEKISGKPLDEFLTEHIISKLGLSSTEYFTQPDSEKKQIPYSSARQINYISSKTRNDELTGIMNGITAVQGLYSSTNDIATFAQMLLQQGYYDDKQIINANTVKQFIMNFITLTPHGCTIWIDEREELFLIILSNPDIKNGTDEKFIRFIEVLKNTIYDELTLGSKND